MSAMRPSRPTAIGSKKNSWGNSFWFAASPARRRTATSRRVRLRWRRSPRELAKAIAAHFVGSLAAGKAATEPRQGLLADGERWGQMAEMTISQNETRLLSERASEVPTWYTATMVPASARVPLTFDLDVEVCVIGAGLAGLTAAREIARRGCSVVVLESRRIAWSASGRNDGFVLPGFAASMDRLISRVGLEHAKALWALSEMGLKYVRTTIAEARMPGVAPIAGWLKASKVDNGDEVLAKVELYQEELGAEVEAWPTERVREELRTNHYFHAMHLPRAFHIHPLNY